MKRLAPALAGCITVIATASAVAQQAASPTTPEPPYGYYNIWGEPWGWHVGMMIGPIMMMLIIVGIVASIVLLVRGIGYNASHHWFCHAGHPYSEVPYRRRALDILEERFAKGEIDKAEFEEKRKLLGR